ncbi:hypothetical protein CDAR_451071 [Caerostris darwini]|uniref:Uncharacterized protein n=1 Tax=Caerostris darwini TaxID=1538125 RepID=A0AAV4PQU7_9ARAC|nr:hypothetical protein CDAR_451071 [Caerostris darwini]
MTNKVRQGNTCKTQNVLSVPKCDQVSNKNCVLAPPSPPFPPLWVCGRKQEVTVEGTFSRFMVCELRCRPAHYCGAGNCVSQMGGLTAFR